MTEFAAVVALLAAISDKYPVHDGEAVTADGNPFTGSYYVVYGGGLSRIDDNRLTAPQHADADRDVTFTVRAVSPTPSGVRVLTRLAVLQLAGARPAVTGRACQVRCENTVDPSYDDSLRPITWFADASFTVTSSRV